MIIWYNQVGYTEDAWIVRNSWGTGWDLKPLSFCEKNWLIFEIAIVKGSWNELGKLQQYWKTDLDSRVSAITSVKCDPRIKEEENWFSQNVDHDHLQVGRGWLHPSGSGRPMWNRLKTPRRHWMCQWTWQRCKMMMMVWKVFWTWQWCKILGMIWKVSSPLCTRFWTW